MDHRLSLHPLHLLNRRTWLRIALACVSIGASGCLQATVSPFDLTAGGPLRRALAQNVAPRFLAITNTATLFAYSGKGSVMAIAYSTPPSPIRSTGRMSDGQLLAVTGVAPSDTYYLSIDEGRAWTAQTASREPVWPIRPWPAVDSGPCSFTRTAGHLFGIPSRTMEACPGVPPWIVAPWAAS